MDKSLEEQYQDYLRMTSHLPEERPTFEEYKKSRDFVSGLLAETDAERILKAEAARLNLED